MPVPDFEGCDWEGASAWATRAGMAALGWRSEFDAATDRAGTALEIRVAFVHEAWHGTLCQVHLPALCRIPFSGQDEMASAVRGAFARLAALGRRAWREFPDSVPCLLPGGRLEESAWETGRFRSFPEGVRLPERARPTEALPGWPGQPRPHAVFGRRGKDREDGWLRAALGAVSPDRDVRWSDSLNPWTCRAHDWQYQDRVWGLDIRPRAVRWGDRILISAGAPKPFDHTVRGVDPVDVEAGCREVLERIRRLRAAYPPHEGVLPPGFQPYVPTTPPASDSLDPEMDSPATPGP